MREPASQLVEADPDRYRADAFVIADGSNVATGAPTLLTVQGSALSPDAAAAWVTSQGGQVLAVYDVADALLVTLPAVPLQPAVAYAVSDTLTTTGWSTTLATTETRTGAVVTPL